MSSERNLLFFTRLSLTLVFVVIIAGSVVRITGSGMGCPDWPFCFGYVIPPTNVEPLTFREGRDFEKGQMVIDHDTLWVATHDFKSGSTFSKYDWIKYPKHDYAVFNPVHTWIEYINRLATGVLGLPILIMSILALINGRRTKNYWPLVFAFLTVFMIGFEAWLGKLVVDGNLKENSITLHMLGTMGIIASLMGLLANFRNRISPGKSDKKIMWLVVALLLLTIMQIVMGTQVREEIDLIARRNDVRSTWIEELPAIFKIHRSFAIAVTLISIYLFMMHRKMNSGYREINWILVMVFVEALSGMVLSYLGMPAYIQPVHLVCAMILFALCLSWLLHWKLRSGAQSAA
ncbi:MAG: COX15/CtaA family protein [Flavobacteriales bacterium]